MTRSHAPAWECIQLEIAKDTITSYAFLNILTKLRVDDISHWNFALSNYLKKRGFYELNPKTPFLTKRGGVLCFMRYCFREIKDFAVRNAS